MKLDENDEQKKGGVYLADYLTSDWNMLCILANQHTRDNIAKNIRKKKFVQFTQSQ